MRIKIAILWVAFASLIVMSVVTVQAGDVKGTWSSSTGSWEGVITYMFDDTGAKKWTDEEKAVVRVAIATWEGESEKVKWMEVDKDADITIKWASTGPKTGGVAGEMTLDGDDPDGVIFNPDATAGWYVDPDPSDVDIQAGPGISVIATLSGPGLITSAQLSGDTSDDGLLRLTWRINLFGSYSVSGTAGGTAFSDSVNVN